MADDIAQWLEGLGLGQYAQAFADVIRRKAVSNDFSELQVGTFLNKSCRRFEPATFKS